MLGRGSSREQEKTTTAVARGLPRRAARAGFHRRPRGQPTTVDDVLWGRILIIIITTTSFSLSIRIGISISIFSAIQLWFGNVTERPAPSLNHAI